VAGHTYSENSFLIFAHSNICSSISNGIILYNIDTHKSGAPVYISGEDQCRQLVGIHKGYLSEKNQYCATMITKSVILTLKDWAKEMTASFKVINLEPTIESANRLIEKSD